jgi:nitrite reductase (NADH) small subunit
MDVLIGPLSDIPPGEGRNVEIGELRIAVFHLRNGNVHAVQSDCPHRGGPLADGLTDDSHVVCPLHDRIYDLETGQEIGSECRLKVYPTRIASGGLILVETNAGDPND